MAKPKSNKDVTTESTEPLTYSVQPAGPMQKVPMVAEPALHIEPALAVLLDHKDAKIPTRSTEGAAGLDLYAIYDGEIGIGGQVAVDTGIKIALPAGHVGLVWPRSGLAVNNRIDTMAGVIDEDYRGRVLVVLNNHFDRPFHFKKGDRIAQLIIQKVEKLAVRQVESLDGTSRGEGGIGSTGA